MFSFKSYKLCFLIIIFDMFYQHSTLNILVDHFWLLSALITFGFCPYLDLHLWLLDDKQLQCDELQRLLQYLLIQSTESMETFQM